MVPIERRWKEKSATFVATLVYLDEPQIVLLDHGDDSKIIGIAIEKEGMEYPFLGSEISSDQWHRYRRQFVDLRYLFLLPRWRKWYLFDLADEGPNRKIPIKKAEKDDYRNPEYLPDHGFFSRDHTELEESATAETISQKFLIDGTWEPTDLSLFFGRINDLYSFFLGIQKFISEHTTNIQKRTLIQAFTDNTLHSGFNYVNFYGDLKGLVDFDERLAMGSIVKQSPGYVDIEGLSLPLAEVSMALAKYEADQEPLRTQYNELHGYLSRMKLLKSRAEKVNLTDASSAYIRNRNQRFAAALGVDLRPIYRLTGHNAISTAKILLSHHRRLERYHLFFVEGRVNLAR